MEAPEHYLQRLERAKKMVKELKDFYNHVKAFILVNILLLLVKSEFLELITLKGESVDPDFLDWLDWNFIITPVLWGIGLLIHGMYAHRYKFEFIRDWESRQIQKYIQQEQEEMGKYEE
jgi:hypothetical protein